MTVTVNRSINRMTFNPKLDEYLFIFSHKMWLSEKKLITTVKKTRIFGYSLLGILSFDHYTLAETFSKMLRLSAKSAMPIFKIFSQRLVSLHSIFMIGIHFQITARFGLFFSKRSNFDVIYI